MSLTELDQRRALRGAQSDLSHSFPGLTGFEERLYVAGVLRGLLRSFPGAHGCHNPNLELGISQVESPKISTKRWHTITPVLTKSSLKPHGRLRGVVDASSAICRPPSWGNVIGNDQPGAPGSSSEWSRGESRWSGDERGGREGLGRCSVNLRKLSEMSRGWVIDERRRSLLTRVRPTYGEI